MTTEIIYKVLWVDDLNYDENNELTDFYEGWQLKAGKYNIELIPFDNWEEAEYSLRKDFDDYSAIILDANCKIRKNDTEQEEFITAVLPSLTVIFGEKRRVLPWYLLSAGTMSSFSKIVNGAHYQHSKHEEDWGTMLYLKDVKDGENAPEILFENIARVAKDLAMNVILYRHHDTFCYLGQDKLIDARAHKLMLRMLSALYYPEDNIKYEYAGNPLRKVLEYLFWSALSYGLLPEQCLEEDKGKGKKRIAVQLASLFMAGANVKYKKDDKNYLVRWGKAPSSNKANDGDSIFTPEIATIVNNIRIFTNEDSHASEDEPWYIDEGRKDIFFGFVLQMCHVIRWYGKYVTDNSSVEENKKKHCVIELSAETSGSKVEDEFKVKKAKKPKVEVATSLPPSITDIKGKQYLVMSDGKILYCGKCKLDPSLRSIKEYQRVTLVNVVHNEGKDKDKYPYIATELK